MPRLSLSSFQTPGSQSWELFYWEIPGGKEMDSTEKPVSIFRQSITYIGPLVILINLLFWGIILEELIGLEKKLVLGLILLILSYIFLFIVSIFIRFIFNFLKPYGAFIVTTSIATVPIAFWLYDTPKEVFLRDIFYCTATMAIVMLTGPLYKRLMSN